MKIYIHIYIIYTQQELENISKAANSVTTLSPAGAYTQQDVPTGNTGIRFFSNQHSFHHPVEIQTHLCRGFHFAMITSFSYHRTCRGGILK